MKVWTPKDEENVSDCLARHLERDLKSNYVHVAGESDLPRFTVFCDETGNSGTRFFSPEQPE